MKQFIGFWFLSVVTFTSVLCEFHDRKILVSRFDGKTTTLAEIQKTRQQLREQSLSNLYGLPQAAKSELIQHAEHSFTKDHYPVKYATDYMKFFRDGNLRDRYRVIVHLHRDRIAKLMLGHLLEAEQNKTTTKYVDEIVNGIWILMEESTWCYPYNLFHQGTNDSLPNPDHLAVDANAGEVAKFLGWVKLLMADKFDQVSTVINKRIDHELRWRVFEGYLNNDYKWAGFSDSTHHVNNHDIWQNGDILKSALYTLNDIALFTKVLNKTIYSADYFLDVYGDDGGCDEGPVYWRHAGGRLIVFIELLEQIFGPTAHQYFASFDLIKRIGEYAYKMRISQNWFVNYADAVPLITYPPALIAKFGILFNDETLKQFSAYMLQFVQTKDHPYFGNILNFEDISEFFNYVNLHKEIESYKPIAPELDHVWLPDIQVVNVRSKATEKSQLFLGAKAGNNHESHNHNDVGNFVLFQDGHPVVIDIGVGTYIAQTFNSHRYELFYMQSQYHNCPSINGFEQQAGKKYTSHNTTYLELANQEGVHFQSNISGAYPKTAHVKDWFRSFHFNRTSNSVQVDDQFELTKFLAPQQQHYIIHSGIEVIRTAGGLHLKQANKVNLHMNFDWQLFEMVVEEKSLNNDPAFTKVWGESVKRITLTTKQNYKELSGHFTVRFSVVQ